jgi:hypothetical protein
VLLFGYEVFATRRSWGFPPADDPDDPWRSILDDLYDWFTGARVNLVMMGLSVVAIGFGTFYSISSIVRSTYVCFAPLESRTGTLLLQFIGLALDAVVVVLFWRILGWTRTVKSRLRTLGTVLCLSSVCMLCVWASSSMLSSNYHRFRFAMGTLYTFDIFIDSGVVAVLLVSATFWICETSPIIPATTITLLAGLWSSFTYIRRFGDWLHVENFNALFPFWILVCGIAIFMHCHGMRSIMFIPQILVSLTFIGLGIAATVYISSTRPDFTYARHPISDLIYKANIEHDRWVRQATLSESLAVALDTYEERHPGQSAPPYFAEWFKFAQGTVVIDDFSQIDKDLASFWQFKPAALRERVTVMAGTPGVANITIQEGLVSYGLTEDVDMNKELGQMAEIIKKFAAYLPDMVLPINTMSVPRVLPSWEEAHSFAQADIASLVNLISKRQTKTEATRDEIAYPPLDSNSANDFRRMQIEACAPESKARTTAHWNVAEFCSFCIRRHSKAQFLTRWDRLLETCEQPDLKHLHGMYMTVPERPPVPELLPLFSVAKTDAFSDILIPMPSSIQGRPDIRWQFTRRYDGLFWRGKIGPRDFNPQALRGNHKYRLLHLLLDPSPLDEVMMVLPIAGRKDIFGYEKVPASEASGALPFNVGVEGFSDCQGANCQLIKGVYGTREEQQDALEYRYILLLDEDNGPPAEMMRAMRSESVPLVSTIFKSWYSDRLVPYLHFVPIDPRFHGLHTSYAYFTGTVNRPKLNGRDANLKPQEEDAKWIAQQGSKWAESAIGMKDLEAYLFRLLLEWGRLIDDQRHAIGFRRTEQGGFDNIGWSKATSPRVIL